MISVRDKTPLDTHISDRRHHQQFNNLHKMKFLIVTLALLAAVAADVSHLNNEYLPPHMAKLLAQKSFEYAQQSEEIPQLSTVADDSVAEEKKFTGKIHIDNLNYGPGYAGEITSQTEEKKYYTGAVVVPHPEIPTAEEATEEKKYYTGLVYKPEQEDAAAVGATATITTTTTTVNGETSVPAPGSDSFTQQQAAYWTSVSKEQESVGSTVVAATNEAVSVPAPGSDDFTQQQAAYWTSVSQQQELIAPAPGSDSFTEQQHAQKSEEPEKKYYTGLIYKSGQDGASASTSTTTVVQQEVAAPEKQYYTGLVYKPTQEASQTVVAPGSDDFTQQQAAYYTSVSQQQEVAPALGGGIDTQYATNGGYVY